MFLIVFHDQDFTLSLRMLANRGGRVGGSNSIVEDDT
jgi:hypothetical protein